MAGKDFAVRATPAAVAAIERLRGTARRSYGAFEAELRKQGCRVAGYRLLSAEDGGYSEFCCKRLVDDWRAITILKRHRVRNDSRNPLAHAVGSFLGLEDHH